VGAVTAAIYANSSPKDCQYILEHSEAIGVLVEDDEQLAKIGSVRAELPRLEHLLTFAGLPELEARGREFAAENTEALAEAEALVDEEELFTYIYTSGTTGPPKGCMIRHRNYFEMATVVDKMEQRFVGPEDTLLLYLPLAHNYGRLIHLRRSTSATRWRSAATRCVSARRSSRSVRPRSRAFRAPTRRSTLRSSPGSPTPTACAGRSGSGASASAARSAGVARRARRFRPASPCSTGSPADSSTRRSGHGSAAAFASRTRAAHRSHAT
jgi:acyl-CoA synthetase (AMP-forming)/AMP-acid ligase II